ncbi:MAG: RsmD family RNA methyltransferase [Phycisphaerales bacterium]
MRIIAGTHRGRRYLPPRDEKTTRPITDRVKQSLFDRLWSMGALPDAPPNMQAQDADPPGTFRGLDIFCGTGSLGLEALSRGVDHCTFVDLDRDAVDRLKTNLTDLQLADRARVVKASALNPIWLGQVKPGSINLIFLDPPYALAEDEKGAQDLARLMTDLAKVAAEDCLLSYRTETGITPAPVEGWDGPTSHAYGSMTLHFFTRRPPA